MRRILLLWAFIWGCAPSNRLAYDLSSVESAPAPTHALRLAVLPLSDVREPEPDEHASGLYSYGGLTYRATRLEDLGPPSPKLTEILGQHLSRARVFAQVILVLRAEQAPEADLVLEGSIFRMRGYVEAEAPSKESGRPQDQRTVLAEVVLKDVRIRDPSHPEQVLFDGDFGWSILEPRRFAADAEPDPWPVLSEALHVAVDQLVSEVRSADLSGQLTVADRVELASLSSASSSRALTLDDLSSRTPSGWSFTRTSTASAPIGWTGAPRCDEAVFTQRQTMRFHRALGPYRPHQRLWSCPISVRLSYDAKADYPAHLLGSDQHGRRWFGSSVGETNWPKAEAQLSAALGLVAPDKKHVFEVGE